MNHIYQTLEYDEPIQVNRFQYERIKTEMAGVVATRVTGRWFWKRYWVKLWIVNYRHHLAAILGHGMRK